MQHVFETIALKHQYRAKPYQFTNEECQMLALPKHYQNNLLMGQAWIYCLSGKVRHYFDKIILISKAKIGYSWGMCGHSMWEQVGHD